MSLKFGKYICISFYRKASRLVFEYAIDNNVLCRNSQVKDLGVILDPSLHWDPLFSTLATLPIVILV